MPIYSLIFILTSVLTSAIGHVALKLAAKKIAMPEVFRDLIVGTLSNYWLILGIALHVVSLTLWVIGLKHIPLSHAYPFIALGFVLVSVISYYFLGEHISVMRLVALSLIICGVVINGLF